MPPTSGFQAAIDSNDIILSYGAETVWGTKPSVAFKQVRLTGESLAGTKSRTRPPEINASQQASAAITTKVEAGGDLNFALSTTTFDDFLAASVGGAWGTAVNKSASTIAATGTGFTDSGNGLVTAGIQVGQWIEVAGFTTQSINGYYRVETVAAGVITTYPAPPTTRIAGDPVVITGTMLRNGTAFQSFFLQKQLASDKFLQFPGSWPSAGSIDVAVGDYAKGSFTFLSQNQNKATVDGSTGAQTAAPTGNVIDAINGVGGLYRGSAAISAVIQKLGLKWSREGARTQMGIGSANAQGIGMGTLTVSGSLETYFKDFTLYDEFINETTGPLSFRLLDSAFAGYIFTICNATIMNPKIVAGGPNQDVMASFELEGNPGGAQFGYKTIQIDKA